MVEGPTNAAGPPMLEAQPSFEGAGAACKEKKHKNGRRNVAVCLPPQLLHR